MKLTPKQREELRQKFGGRCAYCGDPLPDKGWHADHVEPVEREWWKREKWWQESHRQKWRFDEATGRLVSEPVELEPAGLTHPERDTLDNLLPACRACNLDKHSMSLEGWRTTLANKVKVCRYASAFRHAERFGLVQIVDKPVVFYFEQSGQRAQEESHAE
jgi:5-methylcytosine-specific restriction endonuclease McrA